MTVLVIRLPGGEQSHLIASRQVVKAMHESYRPYAGSGYFAVPLFLQTRIPDFFEETAVKTMTTWTAAFKWENDNGVLSLTFVDDAAAKAYALWAAGNLEE